MYFVASFFSYKVKAAATEGMSQPKEAPNNPTTQIHTFSANYAQSSDFAVNQVLISRPFVQLLIWLFYFYSYTFSCLYMQVHPWSRRGAPAISYYLWRFSHQTSTGRSAPEQCHCEMFHQTWCHHCVIITLYTQFGGFRMRCIHSIDCNPCRYKQSLQMWDVDNIRPWVQRTTTKSVNQIPGLHRCGIHFILPGWHGHAPV